MQTGTLIGYQDRQNPGFFLGTKIAEGTTSLTDAMLDAKMFGWNERKEAIFTADGREIDGFVAVRGEPTPGRTKTWGVFSPNYGLVSYPDAFRWAQGILDASDLEIETIGHYRDGGRGFIQFRVPQTITVGGVDTVQPYLTVISSHDGSAPVQVSMQALRVACTNMISGILANRSRSYSIRHVGADPLSRGNMTDVRNALGLLTHEVDAFSHIAEVWAQEELTSAQVDEVLEHLFPIDKDDSKRVVSRMENSRELVLDTFHYGDANQGLGSTAWSLLQAGTEVQQWRGERDLGKRAESVMSGGHIAPGRKVARAITTVVPELALV